MPKFIRGNVPWNKNQKLAICQNCRKEFVVSHCERGTFCSQICYWISMLHKELITCLICGKQFAAELSHHRKFCSRACFALSRQGMSRSSEISTKISQALKGKPGRKGWCHSEETKRQIGLSNTGKTRPVSLEDRRKRSLAMRNYCQTLEGKQARSRQMKGRWQKDKATMVRVTRGYSSPNKPEKYLMALLELFFPGQWKYTGDGSLRIGGYKPDFANCNGHKFLIEVFGDYWHSNKNIRDWHETELGRIMAYNGLGFKCFVIWERELYSSEPKEVAYKISRFFKIRPVKFTKDTEIDCLKKRGVLES